MHGGTLSERFGTWIARSGHLHPPSGAAMNQELSPSQMSLLRQARVDVIDAPPATGDVDALALAGLLGREACNTYRITTTGLLLLEQLDMASPAR